MPGLPLKGAKPPVARSPSSTDGADQPFTELYGEPAKRAFVSLQTYGMTHPSGHAAAARRQTQPLPDTVPSAERGDPCIESVSWRVSAVVFPASRSVFACIRWLRGRVFFFFVRAVISKKRDAYHAIRQK